MRRSLLLLTLLLALCGCRRSGQETPSVTGTAPDEEYLMGINRDIVRQEATNIRLLINRYGWEMQTTPSGLHYEIVREGKGPFFRKGDNVRMRCNITLLDGSTVFHSAQDGIKELVIGRSDEPVGLQEALQLLRPGSVAHLIVPSHLAYGSIGDGGRIPGFATLVYTIEIVE